MLLYIILLALLGACNCLEAMNLTHFIDMAEDREIEQLVNLVYEDGITKKEVTNRVDQWIRRQPRNIQEEYERFKNERKYAVEIAHYNVKQFKSKVIKCWPKVLDVLALRNIIHHEKTRKLNIVFARCGRVPARIMRRFIREYALQHTPAGIYSLGQPFVEADFVQWPTVSMPERLEFMNITWENITDVEMEMKIQEWGIRLQPRVKVLFDLYHRNRTKYEQWGRVESGKTLRKLDQLIDKLVDIKLNNEITFKEQERQEEDLLWDLDDRQIVLLKDLALVELKALDQHPAALYGIPDHKLPEGVLYEAIPTYKRPNSDLVALLYLFLGYIFELK